MGQGGLKWQELLHRMIDTQTRPFFVGEFTHSVDGKGRVTIPSQWRLKGAEETYLGLPIPGGTVRVLPPWRVSQLQEEVAEKAKLSDLDGHRALMAVFAAADQFECDKQGRIVLSQRLRNHAAIKTKAVLTGDLNTFTIWNPKTYEDSRSKDDASILSNLGKLGL